MLIPAKGPAVRLGPLADSFPQSLKQDGSLFFVVYAFYLIHDMGRYLRWRPVRMLFTDMDEYFVKLVEIGVRWLADVRKRWHGGFPFLIVRYARTRLLQANLQPASLSSC